MLIRLPPARLRGRGVAGRRKCFDVRVQGGIVQPGVALAVARRDILRRITGHEEREQHQGRENGPPAPKTFLINRCGGRKSSFGHFAWFILLPFTPKPKDEPTSEQGHKDVQCLARRNTQNPRGVIAIHVHENS